MQRCSIAAEEVRLAPPRQAPAASRRGSALLVVLAAAVVAWSCGEPAAPPSAVIERAPEGTPIVLISIDTLRSDRLPMYGYSGVATPALDALRADSILFERAYTHIGLTLPSHGSILSGLLPLDHGMRDNIGYRFPEDVPTLPALLGANGYRTGAFVSSYVLRRNTGLASGFDVYDDEILFETGKQLGVLQRPGAETLQKAASWLREVHQQPFFLFFHIYEPHAPYAPPEPYASRYADPYDGEVALADEIVGKLLAELKRLGVYDEALIILLSDHGEGLMDHGEMDHLVFIYREVLQVPLLLKLPGGAMAGETISRSAQLTDVLPTISQLLDVPPDNPGPGISLLDLAAPDGPERRIFSESVYPRIHFGWSDLASIIEGDYHYIDGPDPELYDLRQDPGETENIVRQRRNETRELRAELRTYDRTLEAPAEVDAETRASLEALGYVSGGTAATEGPLPDPKTRIHVLDDMGRASVLLRDGDYAAAAEAFAKVVEEEPGMPFAWQQLGMARQRDGDRQGALEALVKALELSQGSSEIAVSVADLYFELGEMEQARAHAELALPGSPAAHDIVAKIALQEGDLDTAERHIEQALTDRGQRVRSLITKTALLNRRGQHAEALEVCRQIEREFGARSDRKVLQGMLYQRGTALGSLGRFEEAKASYLESIELAPGQLPAYAALAFIYALENNGPAAGRMLERMLEENPYPAAYVEAIKTLRAMQDEASAQSLLAIALRRWPDHAQLREL